MHVLSAARLKRQAAHRFRDAGFVSLQPAGTLCASGEEHCSSYQHLAVLPAFCCPTGNCGRYVIVDLSKIRPVIFFFFGRWLLLGGLVSIHADVTNNSLVMALKWHLISDDVAAILELIPALLSINSVQHLLVVICCTALPGSY